MKGCTFIVVLFIHLSGKFVCTTKIVNMLKKWKNVFKFGKRKCITITFDFLNRKYFMINVILIEFMVLKVFSRKEAQEQQRIW